MPSKWASLHAGNITDNSISEGVTETIASAVESVTNPLKGNWGLGTFAIVAAVAAVVVHRQNNKNTTIVSSGDMGGNDDGDIIVATFGNFEGAQEGSNDAESEDVGVVVNPEAVPEEAAAEDNVVPKHTTSDKYFEMTESSPDHFENNGFKDFQTAFFATSNKPILDKKSSSSFTGDYSGLDEFIMSHDVPESLVIASKVRKDKVNEVPSVFSGNSYVSDSEARMLAAEAFQLIPNGSPEVIISTLKEILNAYTETSKLGLQLPSSPDEQVLQLKTLSKRTGPVGELAKKILSRI